jgi:hypothetical protein
MKIGIFLLLFAVVLQDRRCGTQPAVAENDYSCTQLDKSRHEQRIALFENQPVGQKDTLKLMSQKYSDEPSHNGQLKTVFFQERVDMNAKAVHASMDAFCASATVPDEKPEREIKGFLQQEQQPRLQLVRF